MLLSVNSQLKHASYRISVREDTPSHVASKEVKQSNSK